MTVQISPQVDKIEMSIVNSHLDLRWELSDSDVEVHKFQIQIRASSSNMRSVPFFEDLDHCDGSDPNIILEKYCSIPLLTLLEEPFMLIPLTPILV